MTRRQFVVLFVCALIPFLMGNAQVSLLPIYFQQLGADPSSNGTYLAVIELALAAGTISSGWLANRFQRSRELFIVASALSIPFSWLLSQVHEIIPLLVLLAITWFLGGLALGLVYIIAGQMAGENERGKVFGMIGLCMGLGTMIGAAIAGYVVNRWDFPTLFVVIALLQVLMPLAAFFLDKKPAAPRPAETAQAGPVHAGSALYVLLLTCLLLNAAAVVGAFARPLLMNQTGFDPGAISSVTVIGGAVGIPVPLIVGWLSDRIGRYRLLLLCCLFGAASIMLQSSSTLLWHFWIAVSLGAGISAGMSISSALATDLVPPEALATSLAWVSAAGWVGGVVGFGLAGYVVQGVGLTPALLVGGTIPLLAFVVLFVMRSVLQPRRVVSKV